MCEPAKSSRRSTPRGPRHARPRASTLPSGAVTPGSRSRVRSDCPTRGRPSGTGAILSTACGSASSALRGVPNDLHSHGLHVRRPGVASRNQALVRKYYEVNFPDAEHVTGGSDARPFNKAQAVNAAARVRRPRTSSCWPTRTRAP